MKFEFLNPVCFGLGYILFFHRLYKDKSVVLQVAAAIGAALVKALFLWLLPRERYINVLILYLLLAFWCTMVLHWRHKLQWTYAVFLAAAFLLYRGVWNNQLSELLIPAIEFRPVLQRALNYLVPLLLPAVLQHWVVRMEPDRKMTRSELFVCLFPPCTMLAVRIGIYHYFYFLGSDMQSEGARVLAWLGGLLAFSILVSLSSSELYFASLRTQQELQLAQRQLEQQYRSFQQQRIKDEQLKSLSHDMQNHLRVLHGMTGEPSAKEYIDDLTRKAEPLADQVVTGSPTVDLILQQKQEECRCHGLQLEAAVRCPSQEPVSAMEWCVLFANCIDNAIEAARNPAITDRVIRVTGGVTHGCFVVRFENACLGRPEIKDGLPPTTKREGVHGYGLKNVRAVLEKHDGSLSIQPEEDRFVLIWMLPVEGLDAS